MLVPLRLRALISAFAATAVLVAVPVPVAGASDPVQAVVVDSRPLPRISATWATKVVYGNKFTVVATVRGDRGYATGTVAVIVRGQVVARGPVSRGVARITVQARWAGTLRMTMQYSGDRNYRGAQSKRDVRFVKAPSTVSVANTGIWYGQSARLSVTVRGAGSTPSGTLAVIDSGRRIGTFAVRGGRASVPLGARVTPGTHRFTLSYSGSSVHAAKSVKLVKSVSRATSKVTASSAGGLAGRSASVGVRVSGVGRTPSGVAVLKLNGRAVSSKAVSGGGATLSVGGLPLGTSRLLVEYTGDSTYLPSTTTVAVSMTRSRSFSDGMHRVGVDIPAGLYRVNAGSESCYWERRSDSSGSFDGILSNDIGSGWRLVQILPSDAYIESNRCGTWRLVQESAGGNYRGGSFPGTGKFVVGTDISPGTYRQTGSCYWARLSGASGDFEEIIANDNTSGTSYVTISASDKVFETSRCGTWVRG